MRKLSGIFFFLLAGSLAFGHDLWLVAEKAAISPGDRKKIFAINGSEFPVSEAPVAADRFAEAFLLDPEGRRTSIAPAGEQEKATFFEPRFGAEGGWWAAVATKPRLIELKAADFNAYLEHDGLPRVLKARKEKGIAERDEVERYSKYAKAYLRVGSGGAEAASRPLGLRIEIVPEKDLGPLRPGDELPVRVLFEGKPLAGFLVQSGREGMEGKGPEGCTDAEGRTKIRIAAAGHWFLRGIHMVEAEGAEHRYESFWASLTFLVEG